MSNIFQNLELQAFRAGITPRTKESREWFRKKVSSLKSINREALMKEDPLKQTTEEIIGSMYMFFYDPKHKETLPYYDTFPLVVVVGPDLRWVLWFEPSLPTTNSTCKDVRRVDGYYNK